MLLSSFGFNDYISTPLSLNMSQGIFFTQGVEHTTLSNYLSPAFNSITMKLSTDSTTFNANDSYPLTYPQPANSSYAPRTLLPFGLSTTSLSAGSVTLGFTSPFVFNFAAYVGPPVTINGFWLETTGPYALAFGPLSAAYTVPFAGGTLNVQNLTLIWGCQTAPPPPPPPPPFLLAATFRAPDNTQLLSYSPEIGSSAETFAFAGNLGAFIKDRMGVLTQSTNTASNIVWNVGVSDIRLMAFVRAQPPGEDAGLCFRLSDSINFNIFEFDESTNLATLYKCVAGSFTALDSISYTPGGTGGHWLELAADSWGVTASIDGAASFTFGGDSFNSTATLHGIFMGGEEAAPTVTFNGLLATKF